MRGRARLGKRTKELVARLEHGEIAVVDHEDLDEVAARGLVDAQARRGDQRPALDERTLPQSGPTDPPRGRNSRRRLRRRGDFRAARRR